MPSPTQQIAMQTAAEAMMPGTRYEATLRNWKGEWGFLSGTSFSGDLFVHRDHLSVSTVKAVEEDVTGIANKELKVTFEFAVDLRNRACARAVKLVEGEDDSETRPLPETLVGQRVTGTIKKLKDSTAECESDAYVGRVAFHVGRVIDGFPMKHLVEGNQVDFEIAKDMRNRTVATKVSLVGQKVANQQNKKALTELLGKRIKGNVRMWKGLFGFIASSQYDGDIFFHEGNIDKSQANCPELNIINPWDNALVEFTMVEDEKGRAQALDVRYVPVEPATLTGLGRVKGQIRSWRDKWGFTTSPYFVGDVFVHADCVPGVDLMVNPFRGGETLEFEVTVDQRGRVSATNVVVVKNVTRVAKQHAPLTPLSRPHATSPTLVPLSSSSSPQVLPPPPPASFVPLTTSPPALTRQFGMPSRLASSRSIASYSACGDLKTTMSSSSTTVPSPASTPVGMIDLKFNASNSPMVDLTFKAGSVSVTSSPSISPWNTPRVSIDDIEPSVKRARMY